MNRVTLACLLAASGLGAMACSEPGGGFPKVLLPCDDPAPLYGYPSPPTLGFVVRLAAGADPVAEAARLASTCGFQVDQVSTSGQWFSAQLDLVQLGCVRCDSSVTSVAANHILFPMGAGR